VYGPGAGIDLGPGFGPGPAGPGKGVFPPVMPYSEAEVPPGTQPGVAPEQAKKEDEKK